MTTPPHSLKGWRGKRGRASRVSPPVASPLEREQKARREALLTLFHERTVGSRLRIQARLRTDVRERLVRENARLLLRQHLIDVKRVDRSIGFMMMTEELEQAQEPDEGNYGGFLHAVCFDRDDDAWPYYAETHNRTRLWSQG